MPDHDRRLLAAIEFHVGLGREGEFRRGDEQPVTATRRDRGRRTVLLVPRSLEGQYVRAEPGRMLLGQGVVVFGENPSIQDVADRS